MAIGDVPEKLGKIVCYLFTNKQDKLYDEGANKNFGRIKQGDNTYSLFDGDVEIVGGSGSGGVSKIICGNGLSGGSIISQGTISIDEEWLKQFIIDNSTQIPFADDNDKTGTIWVTKIEYDE